MASKLLWWCNTCASTGLRVDEQQPIRVWLFIVKIHIFLSPLPFLLVEYSSASTFSPVFLIPKGSSAEKVPQAQSYTDYELSVQYNDMFLLFN